MTMFQLQIQETGVSQGKCIERSIQALLDHVSSLLADSPPSCIIINPVEMSEAEYEALPEFTGW